MGYYSTVGQLLHGLLGRELARNLGDMGKAIERMDAIEKHLNVLVEIKYKREKSWMS